MCYRRFSTESGSLKVRNLRSLNRARRESNFEGFGVGGKREGGFLSPD